MGVSSLMNGHSCIHFSNHIVQYPIIIEGEGLGAEVCMQWLSN